MLMEELATVEAPSDGSFWGGVAVGAGIGLAIGFIIFC